MSESIEPTGPTWGMNKAQTQSFLAELLAWRPVRVAEREAAQGAVDVLQAAFDAAPPASREQTLVSISLDRQKTMADMLAGQLAQLDRDIASANTDLETL